MKDFKLQIFKVKHMFALTCCVAFWLGIPKCVEEHQFSFLPSPGRWLVELPVACF